MKLRRATPALSDLEAIGDYIQTESSAAIAHGVVRAILKGAESLKEFPHLGRAGRVPETRELVVPNTPYILPYRVKDQEVQILSVLHGARRWPETFE